MHNKYILTLILGKISYLLYVFNQFYAEWYISFRSLKIGPFFIIYKYFV